MLAFGECYCCKLACILPPSSLDPRFASGAFTAAKDESRDRFIGDRRPFNSRERSIVRADLPCCPRLRRMVLGKSETVADYNSRTVFACTKFLPHVAKQVVGPRIPEAGLSIWTTKRGMWLILVTSKVGFHKISLRRVPPSNPSSESDYCQTGMTAIVMGDVNAALECAHRRQLLAARALNDRSPLIRGLGKCKLTILSISAFCNFRTCMSLRCQLRCDVPSLQMSTSAGQVWQYTHGRVLGRTPRRRCRHSRIFS